MIPTREQCIADAQTLLGDPAGNAYTPAYLGPCVDTAFREWVTQCDINQIPDAKFTNYFKLPAFQMQFTPAQAGIPNFGEIITLEERDIATSVGVSGASSASPIQVTTSANHGLAQNQEFVTFGIGGQTAANGRWLANVISGTVVSLPGSVNLSAYTSGGTLVVPSPFMAWRALTQVSEIPERVVQDWLALYVWENETFYFVGADTDRLLRIIYYGSGTAPASGSLGYDNIREFISFRTAAVAASTRDLTRAPELNNQANAALESLLDEHVRVMQRQPVRPKAYKAGGYLSPTTWPLKTP